MPGPKAKVPPALETCGGWRNTPTPPAATAAKAEKDYKKALDLGKNDPNSQPETYLGLARCAALQGHFKEAADWLRNAPIKLDQLRALANDPEFAKLRASKYADVFPKD